MYLHLRHGHVVAFLRDDSEFISSQSEFVKHLHELHDQKFVAFSLTRLISYPQKLYYSSTLLLIPRLFMSRQRYCLLSGEMIWVWGIRMRSTQRFSSTHIPLSGPSVFPCLHIDMNVFSSDNYAEKNSLYSHFTLRLVALSSNDATADKFYCSIS